MPSSPWSGAKPTTMWFPWATYTDPEPGRVGLTEAEAREQYGEKNILISLLIGMRNDEGGRVGSKEARRPSVSHVIVPDFVCK